MGSRYFFSILGFILLYVSCGESFPFQDSKTIKSGEWFYTDTIDYSFEIEDTTQTYDLMMDISHGIDYPFQNIYLSIHTIFPNGKRTQQTVPVDFCDKTGQWYGKCKGQKCLLLVVLQEKAKFSQSGRYQLKFEQFMREEPVKHVYEIGFKIKQNPS